MIKEKFIVAPPSKARSGTGYHCQVCEREMVKYQYYWVYINSDFIMKNPGTNTSYGFGVRDAFVCSEECITMWILSKI